jgi:hypothetical protein
MNQPQAPTPTVKRTTAPQSFGADGTRALDELLRRTLKVGNPADVNEMLRALQERYPTLSAASTAESMGLPPTSTALSLPAQTAVQPVSKSVTGGEYETVMAQLKQDFSSVVDAPSERDIGVELSGWRDFLLREYGDGANGARLAQDAAQRERAQLAIRRLNEFAWLARLVGISMGEQYWDFRRLGTSLDNAADILRILIGEALYEVGLSFNGLLLQVSATDLRLRGNATVDALAGLISGDEVIFDDWGERIRAYNDLYNALDPELKVYARPEGMKESIDNLVNSFANGVSAMTATSLRQLAATAPVEVGRLRHIALLAGRLQRRQPSSALSVFVQSLDLFLSAFECSRGGALYVDLAMPSPLGARVMPPIDLRARMALRRLVDQRAFYAQVLEGTIVFREHTAGNMVALARNDLRLFLLHLAIDTIASSDTMPPF